ncbi:hypothetical protein MHBO_003309, partial [Bonamia ostreae]
MNIFKFLEEENDYKRKLFVTKFYDNIPWQYFLEIEEDQEIPTIQEMKEKLLSVVDHIKDTLTMHSMLKDNSKMHKFILVSKAHQQFRSGGFPLEHLFNAQIEIYKNTRILTRLLQSTEALNDNFLKADEKGYVDIISLQEQMLPIMKWDMFWYILSYSQHLQIEDTKVRSKNNWRKTVSNVYSLCCAKNNRTTNSRIGHDKIIEKEISEEDTTKEEITEEDMSEEEITEEDMSEEEITEEEITEEEITEEYISKEE